MSEKKVSALGSSSGSSLGSWWHRSEVHGEPVDAAHRRSVSRGAVVEVSARAVRHNVVQVRSWLGSGTRLLGVIKADGYGHGATSMARVLQESGVDMLGVALAEEALELRGVGVSAPVLVMNGAYGREHRDLLEQAITPMVHLKSDLEAFHLAARRGVAPVHLKFDTGMSRLGFDWSSASAVAAHVSALPGIRVAGLMTHFASADGDPEFTALQMERFSRVQACFGVGRPVGDGRVDSRRGDHRLLGHHRGCVVHAANTSAAARHPESHLDMVRCGLGLYGYVDGHEDREQGLQPAMRFRTEVLALRRLSPGDSVGYGCGFVAEQPMQVATLALGFGDGFQRSWGAGGQVLIRGVRCPVVGRVSMDLTTVDVSGVDGVCPGDEAVVFGSQQGAVWSARDVAHGGGTSVYEVLTGVSSRVPRLWW